MGGRDTRTRKWQITINNPKQKGFTHDYIQEQFKEMKSLIYWVMADEIGENGTYHTHIYIHLKNAMRFSTLKNLFDGAHFEMANGTASQNRDYIFKEGKYSGDLTNLKETQKEGGDIPIERQGQRNDLLDLYDMIKDGKSNYEILESNTNFLFDVERIDKARSIILQEKYKNTFRDLQTTYIFGKSGTGKTRYVMEKYGYSNVFRVTDTKNPFDNYREQDVIVFEEFRSSFTISEMLNYLDGYPLELPARYSNKIACYTKVYIISNESLTSQYTTIQQYESETWHAFLRRIHEVHEFKKNKVIKKAAEEYIKPYGLKEYNVKKPVAIKGF